MCSQFRQRSVISSFICTSLESPGGFKFALFKRSDKVSTYRQKWAVCSGSIDCQDQSPAAAARREIYEETQLSDSDASLLRRGKPFKVTDESISTEWTIYPFAWQLRDGAKEIKIDWEHTEYKFIRPEELGNYEHVPQLEVSLERVKVSPETEKGLKTLRNDHTSGAQELALKALKIMLGIMRGSELSDLKTTEDFWTKLRWIAWHLAKNGRPSMSAAIETGILMALDKVQKDSIATGFGDMSAMPLSRLGHYLETTFEAKLTKGKQGIESVAEGLVQFVERNLKVDDKGNTPSSINIATLSSSGTVSQSLTRLIETLAKKGIEVKLYVLESRPNFEGVEFVNRLFDLFQGRQEILARLKINIVSDASVAMVAKDADYILIGADKVIPNGDVSCKIGGAVIAILAKTLNSACKVVVLFETSKITSAGFDSEYLSIEDNGESEITRSWSSAYLKDLKERQNQGYQVEIKNLYFEWVPATYIDHYMSEQMLMMEDDIARISVEREELEKRIFESL